MANGKIKADQIEHSTAGSLDTQYVVGGSAKAWVNLNGTGTIAARDSLSVSGLVDNGTGDISVNFSSSMSNDDYSQSGSSSSGAASGTDTWINAYAWATGYVSVGTNNSSQNLIDRAYVNVNVHGDLA
jgi:hypothetical protein